MNFLISIETGLREILAHKFRSLLSMLGIVLGVSSLIATLALTGGIERGTRTFMEQMGGLELVRIVDKEISNELLDFWSFSPGRTLQDARAIQASAPLISHVSPEVTEGAPVSYGGITFRARLQGVWPDYRVITKLDIGAGRFITELDNERALRTVVVGHTIARTFFPHATPEETIGRTIFVNDVPFTIVGVLKLFEREQDRKSRERGKAQEQRRLERGGGQPGRRWDPFRMKNETVIIPFSTLFYEFKSGLFPLDSIDTFRIEHLNVRVSDLDHFDQALEQVRSALSVTHRGVDDFGFDTREDWFENMETSIRATRISGGLIAAISLVVGGIGIANIMLASITERVREIGIRLAVGARGRDIFMQIIIEGVSISLIGGVIGVGAGIGLIGLIRLIAPSDNTPFITLSSIVLSIGFAGLAGLLSGIYPAIKASRLDPIQALRYE